MSTTPLIVCLGVCHRDAELASLWLKWVNFLCGQAGGNNSDSVLLIVHTKRASAQIGKITEAMRGTIYGEFKTFVVECPDELEVGYPKSASHLFLRTLEIAEREFPGSAVLWCEPDTVPMKPSWFAEIAAEYASCGKPFMGAKVGLKFPHLAGNSVYPHNWRGIAPMIANVLSAPDNKLWGFGRGQPWDVWCRNETTPQMAESKLWFHIWKDRSSRPTRLKEIPECACIFHQEKTPHLILEIAAKKYPEFLATLGQQPAQYFLMNGNASRLRAIGLAIKPDVSKITPGGWRTLFKTGGRPPEEALLLRGLVGRYGVSEIMESEYDRLNYP